MSLARLLAHYESPSSSAGKTLVPVEFCRELAHSLRAEKITQRLYRLLPPDSGFAPSSYFPQLRPGEGVCLPQGPGEVYGLKFMPPNPAQRRAVRRAEAIALLGEYVWSEPSNEVSACG